MTTNEWLALIGVALVVGAMAGGLVSLRMARRRFKSRLRRAAHEQQQRHAAMADQLRAAQVRAQSELEQARHSFKRQLAAKDDEPRSATARAEERLKAAYAELDRLRAGVAGQFDTASSELPDGFAATRPMREGM